MDDLWRFLFEDRHHWSLMGLCGIFIFGQWYERWVTKRRSKVKVVGLAKRPSHPFSDDHPPRTDLP